MFFHANLRSLDSVLKLTSLHIGSKYGLVGLYWEDYSMLTLDVGFEIQLSSILGIECKQCMQVYAYIHLNLSLLGLALEPSDFIACWAYFWKSPLPMLSRSSRCWAVSLNHSSGESLTTRPLIWVRAPPTTYLRAIVRGISVGAQGCWEAFLP